MLLLRRLAPLGPKFPGVRWRNFSLMEYAGQWSSTEKLQFQADMRVISDFVTAEEEQCLIWEIEPHISRLPYESSHWDDAIHGYREVQRRKWSPHNRSVLDRVCREACGGQVMPFVHILDLAEVGGIKPHVDSTRFCGHTIAGISLLSDCVMRMKRVAKGTASHSADVLLPRRSLYIMSHLARYKFTHEILVGEQSRFRKHPVKRKRRVSVICRTEP
ncbi:alpha-ketoglutarate-dependent dioxygenase alkB homolog 7, mitochondrial-like [Drosophila gunungcola]|uniref:alpha-ketoglutarate-dependent dioxygenase alkB homolog 7, mitochondrial-like n=1 Tax=Drosophila gunungcola TaxID=103775 RepID=UPI0022E369E5|nr:alpha-ketoglutarate-dependent dioxygenase alkB homolog 7, mitochondrial-like [Drosophila gunungcola]